MSYAFGGACVCSIREAVVINIELTTGFQAIATFFSETWKHCRNAFAQLNGVPNTVIGRPGNIYYAELRAVKSSTKNAFRKQIREVIRMTNDRIYAKAQLGIILRVP